MLYAGQDCSGTPDLADEEEGHNLYALGTVALPVADERANALRHDLVAVGARYHRSAAQEWHAHNTSEQMQADFLEVMVSRGMLVGVLLIDKAATHQSWSGVALPPAAHFQIVAAQAAVGPFLKRYCLARLFCDEDVRGKERQKRLTTALLRIQRETWPDHRMKVRFVASQREPLVQVADMATYVLVRHARGAIRSARLKRIAEAMRADLRNLIVGPVPWMDPVEADEG